MYRSPASVTTIVLMPAAPMPCRKRKTISSRMSPASPHATEAARKRPTLTISTGLRPTLSAIPPDNGVNIACVSRYEANTQE